VGKRVLYTTDTTDTTDTTGCTCLEDWDYTLRKVVEMLY